MLFRSKDGTGGKQMVFAHSKSEAIDIGGSNMGYNQDYSRANLTAVKKTDTLRRYTVTSKYDLSQSIEILAQDIETAALVGAEKLGLSIGGVRAVGSDTSQDGREELSHEIKNGDTGATLERIPKSLNLTPEEVESRRLYWVNQTNLPDGVVVVDPPLNLYSPQGSSGQERVTLPSTWTAFINNINEDRKSTRLNSSH